MKTTITFLLLLICCSISAQKQPSDSVKYTYCEVRMTNATMDDSWLIEADFGTGFTDVTNTILDKYKKYVPLPKAKILNYFGNQGWRYVEDKYSSPFLYFILEKQIRLH